MTSFAKLMIFMYYIYKSSNARKQSNLHGAGLVVAAIVPGHQGPSAFPVHLVGNITIIVKAGVTLQLVAAGVAEFSFINNQLFICFM
eukprot:scaffold26047_cov55-Attheya_sp.AAC.7